MNAVVEGQILYWIVVDAETGEPILQVPSRRVAREWANTCDGKIAKVEVSR